MLTRNRLTPFAWDEQIMADAGLHFPELFEQAREFGVTHGYTFVLHDYSDNPRHAFLCLQRVEQSGSHPGAHRS
ncbi:autoinducer binding domain-containing protein [Serratia ureilytica]